MQAHHADNQTNYAVRLDQVQWVILNHTCLPSVAPIESRQDSSCTPWLLLHSMCFASSVVRRMVSSGAESGIIFLVGNLKLPFADSIDSHTVVACSMHLLFHRWYPTDVTCICTCVYQASPITQGCTCTALILTCTYLCGRTSFDLHHQHFALTYLGRSGPPRIIP